MDRARRTVLTVALGHFAVDFTAQLPNMMYPLLAVGLGMSYTMIGLAALVFVGVSSVTQPLCGYLGDRFGRRWMASLSPTWIAIWVSVAAFAPSYAVLLILLGVAGLGVGVFHPQGAALASEAARHRKGASVATFFLGGHLAFAITPLLIGAIFAAFGLGLTPLLAAPVLLVTVVMIVALRGLRSERAPPERSGVAKPSGLVRAMGAVLLIVLVRGWAYASFNTFIPIIVSIEQPDPALAGVVLSSFMTAHATGAFAGGFVADRLGLRRMLGYSSLFAIPLIGAFGLLPFGPWHTLLAAAAGGVIGIGFTPSVVLMQRLAPRRVGAASGLVLGVSFGAGAVGSLATGLVADLSGFDVAFGLIAIGQLVVLASLRWLPATPATTAPEPTRRAIA